MQVSVEKTSELGRKMTISVPEDVIQEKMEARFKSLVREVKLDGFRPGKVPLKVVKKKFGDRVRGEVAGDIIQNTYYDALRDQELVPAGQPHIQPTDKTEGLEYTAEFEVYPEVSLEGIDQLEIKRPQAEIQDADLEAMLTKLREQKKDWQEVERTSQEKDRVTVHFSGESESENFTDGKVENYQVEIGSKQMIPGFEDELTGLSAGDAKTFDIAFPEDYGNPKLAGKTATFEIELIKVEEAFLPEIDEEFIKAYGVEDGQMETFRADVRDNMQRELNQALKAKLKAAVMDALVDRFDISVPASLIDQEVQELKKPYEANAKRQNVSLEDLEMPVEQFEEQARRRVTLGLLLGEIIRQNEIKADDDKVRAEIEKMAYSYEQPEDVINWYYADESRLRDVQQIVLEDQTVDWIVNQSKVSDESITFDAAMSR